MTRPRKARTSPAPGRGPAKRTTSQSGRRAPADQSPIDRQPASRGTVSGRAVADRRPVHVPDLQSVADEFPEGSAIARALGHRTVLAVPLLSADAAIGAITVRRAEVSPFSEDQVALLETFADQAVHRPRERPAVPGAAGAQRPTGRRARAADDHCRDPPGDLELAY